MTDLRHAVETLIRDDGGAGPFPLEPCCRGLSRGLAAAAALKNRLYDKGALTVRRLACPVISVGNITVGGTGKTPMTMLLARHLKERGFRPLILSRGYGGRATDKGGVVSDGKTVLMDAAWAGDEPLMMAAALPGVPVVVGKDRSRMGRQALARFSPDVILLDDGFQHRKLHRDLDIVLFDACRPFGNGFALPRGPLREPVAALARAHLFVLTRADDPAESVRAFHARLEALGLPSAVLRTPVITCGHRPVLRGIIPADRTRMASAVSAPAEAVFAFSGIANNDDVKRSLDALGFTVAGCMAFPDHHPYSADDLAEIARRASAGGAHAFVTTDKDAARLGSAVLPLSLYVAGIDLAVTGNDEHLIDRIINRAGLAAR
ncbi:tetraacyldisaccharide 4'-kinase [Desulfatiferula olefinivorans]